MHQRHGEFPAELDRWQCAARQFSFILGDGAGGNYRNELNGSSDPAFFVDSTNGSGNFTVNNGSGIDHSSPTSGVGFDINDISGSVGVNVDTASLTGSQAYIIGTTGVEIYGTGINGTGVLNFTNYGLVKGTVTDGLYAAWVRANVTNHRLMKGDTNGAEFNQVSSVDYDNSGGITGATVRMASTSMAGLRAAASRSTSLPPARLPSSSLVQKRWGAIFNSRLPRRAAGKCATPRHRHLPGPTRTCTSYRKASFRRAVTC